MTPASPTGPLLMMRKGIINAPLRMTLRDVGTTLRHARDPWWVIGSAAVALHGADPGQVADVDVLLTTSDAVRVLSPVGVRTQPGSPHPRFRSSLFGRWDGPPLPVEFMAGFHHLAEEGWVKVEPKTREPVDVDGLTVFIPGSSELQRLLEAFGRPKDLERARRLNAVRDR